jgi:hypothetical protein
MVICAFVMKAIGFVCGPIAKAYRWCNEILNAPNEIRALKAMIASQNDPRPICTSCGTGRVGLNMNSPLSVPPLGYGSCDECQSLWTLTPDGTKLKALQVRGAR